MKTKRAALIDVKLLMLSENIMRRASREKKLRFKRGRRTEAMGHVYNMLAVGLIRDYESFLTITKQALKTK